MCRHHETCDEYFQHYRIQLNGLRIRQTNTVSSIDTSFTETTSSDRRDKVDPDKVDPDNFIQNMTVLSELILEFSDGPDKLEYIFRCPLSLGAAYVFLAEYYTAIISSDLRLEEKLCLVLFFLCMSYLIFGLLVIH